jgi:hypothetical protein
MLLSLHHYNALPAVKGYVGDMDNEKELTEGQDTEMVAVFSSSNHDAEMEVLTIKGILDSEGVPALVVGPSVLPNLEFQVQVPAELAGRAEELIAAAREAGPAAAAEGEALSEELGSV